MLRVAVNNLRVEKKLNAYKVQINSWGPLDIHNGLFLRAIGGNRLRNVFLLLPYDGEAGRAEEV